MAHRGTDIVAPRLLFLRLTILVTLILLLPDVYILYQGQPAKAGVVLVCMHLTIALVTYNALVHLAPARSVPVQSSTTSD